MCFNIYNNEVVTIAEAAETVEMTETTGDEAQHEWIPSRRKGGSKAVFSTIKPDKYGKQCRQTVLGIKGTA